MGALTPISMDIETTGFEVDDTVTVVGFSLPLGCRIFLNTGGKDVDPKPLHSAQSRLFETTIKLSVHPTEKEILSAVTKFSNESLSPRDYLLVAYNGERWRSGFDLPFLRTRYSQSEIKWPFTNLPYSDLMPIFESRFNTTSGETSLSDLEGVYKTLIGNDLTELDPFDDSKEAVDAFHNGEFNDLIQHNVSDILRTDALAHVAERYCGKSDFKLKSLTPASDLSP